MINNCWKLVLIHSFIQTKSEIQKMAQCKNYQKKKLCRKNKQYYYSEHVVYVLWVFGDLLLSHEKH